MTPKTLAGGSQSRNLPPHHAVRNRVGTGSSGSPTEREPITELAEPVLGSGRPWRDFESPAGTGTSKAEPTDERGTATWNETQSAISNLYRRAARACVTLRDLHDRHLRLEAEWRHLRAGFDRQGLRRG